MIRDRQELGRGPGGCPQDGHRPESTGKEPRS